MDVSSPQFHEIGDGLYSANSNFVWAKLANIVKMFAEVIDGSYLGVPVFVDTLFGAETSARYTAPVSAQ